MFADVWLGTFRPSLVIIKKISLPGLWLVRNSSTAPLCTQTNGKWPCVQIRNLKWREKKNTSFTSIVLFLVVLHKGPAYFGFGSVYGRFFKSFYVSFFFPSFFSFLLLNYWYFLVILCYFCFLYTNLTNSLLLIFCF